MLGIELNTLVTYNPIAVAPSSTLLEVLRLMEQHDIHHLPVVDAEFRILGIVSDFDIAQVVAGSLPLVEDIMVRSVMAIEQTEPPEAILRAIIWHGFHSVPMVDEGRLTGIVTSTDFLREFSNAASNEQSEPVSEFMIPCRWQIEASATFEEADQYQAESGADYLGVIQSGRAIGVISARQLRRARLRRMLNPRQGSFAESAWHFGQVKDLLPAGRLLLYPEQTLGEAATMMYENKVQALAVLARGGQIDGLLTESEILEVLARRLV
jgi:CBS domain-containing protein